MSTAAETLAVSDDGFTFPVTEVLTGRGFVTGKSGSGKSNTASVIAEELLERGLPLLIVDTDGEYYGLNETYEMLHVGGDDDCDLPIDPADAPEVADLALGEELPVLLDLSGYPDEAASEAVLLATLEALFEAETDHRKPFLVLVEEMHEFAPQQGGSTDLSRTLIRVAKRGRKRGLGICGMSQRPAAVDKDYITQCNWLVWHRLTWENDTAVADRILGDDAAETVQSLADGEALVLTDWDETVERVQFRRKRTADAGSTPDVESISRTSPAERHEAIARLRGEDPDAVEPPDRPDRRTSSDSSGTEGSSGTAESFGPGEPTPTEDGADEIVPPAEPSSSEGESSKATEEGPDAVESSGGATAGPSDDATSAPAQADETSTGAARSPRSAPDTAGASSGSPRRAPTNPSRDDGYDPLWEGGQLVVHLFWVVVRAHRRAVDRLEAAIANWRVAGTDDPTQVTRAATHRRRRPARFVRALAVGTVLACYAVAIAAIVVFW